MDLHASPVVVADLYLRLSDFRKDDRDSFGEREVKLREAADRLGWQVRRVVVENDVDKKGNPKPASAFKRRKCILPDGTVGERVYQPGLRSILEAMMAGTVTAILAEDLDRGWRDPRELEDFVDIVEGRRLNARSLSGSLTLTDGGTDSEITMARVMVAMANKSSRDTSRRVKDGMARKQERGEFTGGPRVFGVEPDGRTVRTSERPWLEAGVDEILATGKLYRVARDWNAAGVRTPRGNVWAPGSVKSVMLRASNPRLFPDLPWDAVHAILGDPSRKTSGGAPPRWLGTSLYRCGGCLRASLAVQGSQQRYYCQVPRRWPGATANGVVHVKRQAAPLDAYVEWTVVSFLDKHRDLFLSPRAAVDLRSLRAEELDLKQRLRTQAERHVLGKISDDELEAGSRAGNARLVEIRAALAHSADGDPVGSLLTADNIAHAWFGEGPERVGGYSLERRRAILERVAQVTVLPTASSLHGFDPESIEIIIPRPV